MPRITHNVVLTIATLVSSIGVAPTFSTNGRALGQSPSGSPKAEAQKGFAVVELFTSQGCSSCPSADQNLARIDGIAKRSNLDVYVLSFHVDYWNNLGWKDPFSTADATNRQRAYATAFRSRRVYTPQMIVNGSVEFVGSDQAKSNAAITSALKRTPPQRLKLSARRSGQFVEVQWTVAKTSPGDRLIISLVENRASKQVTAGENAGRQLSNTNIVREFRIADPQQSDPTIELSIPDGFSESEFHVVAFLQSSSTMRIKSAEKASITGA